MDKEQAKAKADAMVAKAKVAMAEIKANFKPDEGTTGAKKIQSMFVNLWKSGTTGKGALVAATVVVLLLLSSIFGRSESSEKRTVTPQVPAVAGDEAAGASGVVKAQQNKVAEMLKAQEERAAQFERDLEKEKAARDASAKEESDKEAKRLNLMLAMRSITDLDSAKRALDAAKAVGDEDAIKKANKALAEYEQEAKEKEQIAKAVAEVESAMKEVKDVASAKRVLELAEKTEDTSVINKAEQLLEKQEQIARKAADDAKKAAKRAAYEAIPSELAVKGIAIRMSGDAAFEACNKLVASEKDLEVLDYRKGIVREKDEETKAKDKKYWEDCLRRAAADIERFLKWNSVDGETYQPAVDGYAASLPPTQKGLLEGGPLTGTPNLYVQWGDRKNATIPGPNYTVASAMAALAGVCGYQVEWMLPGRRICREETVRNFVKEFGISEAEATKIVDAGYHTIKQIGLNRDSFSVNSGLDRATAERVFDAATKNPWGKNMPKPELLAIETLKSADFLKFGRSYGRVDGHGCINGIINEVQNTQGRWYAELCARVYDKGLRLHRRYGGHVYFRLVLQDDNGKPVDKSDLATEIACNYPELFAKGGSNSEKVKKAEEYVAAIMEWADGRQAVDAANTSYRNSRGKNDSDNGQNLLDKLVSQGLYVGVLDKLAMNCKVSVEFAVLVEPVEKLEQITEVFTIPASNYKEACKYVSDMDRLRLGKWSEGIVGNDGSRKKVFFKHDIDDVGSPLWFRLVLKDKDGKDLTKEEVIQKWLNARGHYKPSDTVRIPPQNVIKIVIAKKGVAVDKLTGICYTWLDDAGNVKETYYTEEGMARLFDARDLTGEKFADLLVKSYPGLPALTLKVETMDPGRGKVQDNIWTYECPKGYRVKLYERTYISKDGVTYYNADALKRDAEVVVGLALADLLPTKHLSIVATKPDAARKFD